MTAEAWSNGLLSYRATHAVAREDAAKAQRLCLPPGSLLAPGISQQEVLYHELAFTTRQ
jgi:hypothetical protein